MADHPDCAARVAGFGGGMIPSTVSFSTRLDFPHPWLTFNTVELAASLGMSAHGTSREVLDYIDVILEAA